MRNREGREGEINLSEDIVFEHNQQTRSLLKDTQPS